MSGDRGLYLYDHMIVAMQFLSFEFLVFAVAWLIPGPVRDWALAVAAAWTPVNLFMTLRGAYGSGVVAAMLKTVFLWVSTLVLFAALDGRPDDPGPGRDVMARWPASAYCG